MKALNDFRILEYKDSFKVERLFEKKEYKWWDLFRLYPIISFEYWTITKLGERVYISGGYIISYPNPLNRFKSKEKAEKWIEDFFKYPIIHEYKNRINTKNQEA